VHVLAEKFQRLQASDLIEVIKMVKANQTSEMYVREDGEGNEQTIRLFLFFALPLFLFSSDIVTK